MSYVITFDIWASLYYDTKRKPELYILDIIKDATKFPKFLQCTCKIGFIPYTAAIPYYINNIAANSKMKLYLKDKI